MKKIIIPAILALVFLTKTVTAQTVVLRQPARRMIVVKPCPRIVAAPRHYVRPLAFIAPPLVVVPRPVIRVRPAPLLRPARVVVIRR